MSLFRFRRRVGEVREAVPRRLGVIHEFRDAVLARAVCAAEELAIRLKAVAKDAALAVVADWCQLMGGAFDAVEDVHRACGVHFESELVIVVADLAYSHG